MSPPVFIKQPADVIDVDIDASAWLPADDNILYVSSIADAGLTLGENSVNTTTKMVKQWVSEGAAGSKYKVTVTITSTNIPARVKEVEFYIKVKEV